VFTVTCRKNYNPRNPYSTRNMSEEERLEKLSREIQRVSLGNRDIMDLLSKIYELLKTILAILELLKPKIDNAFVCADPHTTGDGHLNGAYSEGEQIKDLIESCGYTVTLKRHPVSSGEFLEDLDKRIVHLAGHGGFDGTQVYFCFDDCNLYPADISSQASRPDLLFYAGVCLGGTNDTMANVFISKGTRYYVGFTESIPDWEAKYFDELVYQKWLAEGKDLGVALDEADDDYPELDCWVLWGS